MPSSPITGSDVANAVLGGSYANWNAAAGGQADTVRFTATVAGPQADLSLGDFGGGFAAGSATLTKITEGAAAQDEPGVQENFTVRFTAPNPLDFWQIVFDGKTYTIPEFSPAAGVRTAILQQGDTANWAVAAGSDPAEVVFTFRTTSDQTDITTGALAAPTSPMVTALPR
ncbi:MAG: hypothetical protein MZW92_07110 [Comamonadaceae bacterium]|nr:hypothetical protein [Comamonadaceae bacterium]